jgi:hypothetical protein
MGWHGGALLEQPPLNLKDHFFQRRRWVLGTLQNGNKFPMWHRFKLLYKSITYFLGFASAVASTAFAAYNYIPALLSPSTYISDIEETLARFTLQPAVIDPVEIGIGAVLLFTSLVWLSSYQLGLYLNLRYSDIGWKKRVRYHFQTLILCPIIGLVETFPAFWAMIEYNVKKKSEPAKAPVYDFYVVTK